MQYMPPDDATRLIQCVATQFPHAVFISYDQICPSDSFGKVMVRSLKQKASPLLGISTTPDPSAIVSRLKTQGLAHVYFADFYDISRFYLTGKELARVEGLEPFDELEEWSEMCGHYGISFATNLDLCTVPLVQCPFLRPFHSVCATNPPSETEAGLTPLRVKYLPWPTARPCFEGWGNGQVLVETHPYTKGCIFIGFGGFLAASSSNHHRANVVFAHALCDGAMKVNLSSSEENPPELVFHSINRLSAYRYVVFGGRSNPTTPSSAAYLLEMVVSLMSEVIVSWSSLRQLGEDKVGVIAVLPPARYRHISVTLSESEFFIFGGRDARGVLLGDAWVGVVDVATRRILWRQVRLTGSHTPPAMCSAAAVLLSSNGKEVLLSGGLIDDGRCNEKLFVINTADGTCRVVNLLIGDLCARFSHTMTWVGVNNTEQILILGGCGWTPRRSAAPALLLNIQTMTMTPLRLALECPTWARHCSVSLGQGRLAIIGGGYTCFSFGTFSSKPCLLEIGDVVDPIQNFLPSTPSLLTPGRGCVGSLGASNPQNADFLTILLSLPHRAVREAEAPRALEKFLACMQQCSHPILLRHASLGPCVEKWGDPNYLKEAVKETLVSVHVASGSCLLDFVRKNFTFRHVLFQDLIQHTQDATAYYRTHGKLPDECWYFRSIATHMKSERANVWEDFKVLGQDFSLPDGVRELVMPKMHQSCLRINAAPLQLWTHYDTMENVLAQIVGHKRVILFPPSQYGNLYMSGSSSPVLNLDAPNLLQYPRFIDASKNALEVVLEPGDLLYFPANWHHHITTLADTPEEAPPYSLSINVFYRRFDCSAYDRKDLYGNKDLPAVVSLREKITEQVQELLESQLLNSGGEPLPAEYKEFALRQALHHLESVADSMATSL